MNKKIKTSKITIALVALFAALGLSFSPKAQAGTPHNSGHGSRHGIQISISAGHGLTRHRSSGHSSSYGYRHGSGHSSGGHGSYSHGNSGHGYNSYSNGHGYNRHGYNSGRRYNGHNSNRHGSNRSH